MEQPLLNIKDLYVQFTGDGKVVKAVNGVNLEVCQGETLGLVGETGAGKTTTALSVMQLITQPPGSFKGGEILFEGLDLLKTKEPEMRTIRGKQISMIFQDPMTSLNPVLTVGEQIMEIIVQHEKLSKAEAMIRAKEALELVGIPGERAGEYPHEFSGGMKQRVCIAMSLVTQPKLIIADEPTTALDVTIQAQVLDLMCKLKEELKTAMLLITHDLGIVAEVCDKVAIMYAGEIIESGTLKDIFHTPLHPYTQGLFGSIPKLDKRIRRLTPINGLMPDPANLPAGCSFSPRCPWANDQCAKEKPAYENAGGIHRVSCLRYRDISKHQEKEGNKDGNE